MADTQLSHQTQVYKIHDRQDLLEAISVASRGDTLLFVAAGNYGDIRIADKSGLRITSSSKQLVIQAALNIVGQSNHIIIENLNLCSQHHNKQQVILIGLQCRKVIIRHCIVSSYPVSMNTLREIFSGNPMLWIDGIKVLGDKCDINHNILVNIKHGIIGTGLQSIIANNVIQYFTNDAIAVQHHHMMILNNHIYDAILNHPHSVTERVAIRLIPPESPYIGNELRSVEISGNVIRSQQRSTSVPKPMQGKLRGIFAIQGYFVDISLINNTLVLNTDHGITLSGAKNLKLYDNTVIASPRLPINPGIKLYLSSTSADNPAINKWLADKKHSVRYRNNQAPLFNVSTEKYHCRDQGNNQFATRTNEQAINFDEDMALSTTDATPCPVSLNLLVPQQSQDQSQSHKNTTQRIVKPLTGEPNSCSPNLVPVKKVAKEASRVLPAQVHKITNAKELTRAIKLAHAGDTLVIVRAGNYGHVHILNKSRLRIKSINTDIPLQLSLVIDGTSNNILIENMQIWNTDVSRRQLIITGKSTTKIVIRNCILSTVRVNRNTMRNAYAGDPQQWINGIRMLGRHSRIINNYLLNLHIAVLESGPGTLIQHNLVQFYAEDGIRVSYHGVKVLHNNIYDSVAAHPGQNAHKDAIQLIPPYDRYDGGKLLNVQIIGNIIQSYTHPAVVPTHQRGIVQGIFGSDGYFINTIITGNTVMVNSDHGITLNGVRNCQLSNNRIVDLNAANPFSPGIKLYLTRISQYGKQKWLANRPYSVRLSNNQGAVLNIPDEVYSVQDMENNHFASKTHHLARGQSPVIIRSSDSSTATTPAAIVTHSSIRSTGLSIFEITSKAELKRATQIARSGDTIIFKKSGHYGQIHLTHKTGVRIRSASPDITINANFLIDGRSKNISIENINIWFSQNNWKPVILSGPKTTNISIRNCLISSTQVGRSQAREQMRGSPKRWVTGIWLRGVGAVVKNNHIVNVRVGIVTNSSNVLIQNNLIQYYSEAGMRIINHHIEITHNNIYDAIAREAYSKKLLTGIQLIPPKNRFTGGSIKNIKITHNVIQVTNSGSPTLIEMQGHLQGITLHDGYISGMLLNTNTIVVNTEHGISLNGASGLSLNGNRVFDSEPDNHFIPGIKLYYTRTIDATGNRHQTWRTGRDYSVSYSNNKAAQLNIPDVGYHIHDGGGNNFRVISTNRARGFNPDFQK